MCRKKIVFNPTSSGTNMLLFFQQLPGNLEILLSITKSKTSDKAYQTQSFMYKDIKSNIWQEEDLHIQT